VHDGRGPVVEKDRHHTRPVVDRASLQPNVVGPLAEHKSRLGPKVGDVVDDDVVAAVEERPGHIAAREAGASRHEYRPGLIYHLEPFGQVSPHERDYLSYRML
jgi:hypothetical protein